MAWLTSFLLGRPASEYVFEVTPGTMNIEESGVTVLQQNLAGDLKKSLIKASAPTIKLNSNFLSLAQRNQFSSLVGIADTFLSLIVRDDFQTTDELAGIIDATHIQIANSSAARLSAVYAQLGQASLITIVTPFKTGSGPAFGLGPFGGGPFGIGAGGGAFDPGVIAYNDATRIITLQNPLPSLNASVYVTYTYRGWLVHIDKFPHKAQGGWLDRFTYDFQLIGA